MAASKIALTSAVFVSDLDGTLLSPDAALSKFTTRALQTCIRAGLRFTIATARTIESVRHIMKDVPLTLPMILMNGVLLYDPAKKAYTQVFSIERDDFLFCCTEIHKTGAGAFAYTLNHTSSLLTHYEKLSTPDMQAFHDERQQKYHKPFHQAEDLSAIADGTYGETIYFALLDVKEKLQPIRDAIDSRPNLTCAYYADIYSQDQWYLEIFNVQASKKNAAQALRAQTHAAPLIGFGDNFNDLPLFEACDISIAVANAKPEVQQKATQIIEANTDDGVARYLLSMIN